MAGPFTSIRDHDLEALEKHLDDETTRRQLAGRRVQGLSALHLAVREAWIEGVERLLDAGCDVDTRDDEGQTPLHHAAHDGRFADCSWLHEQPRDERPRDKQPSDGHDELIDRPEPGRSVAFPKDPVVGAAIARILHRRGELEKATLPEAWSAESMQLAEAFHHATWSDDARRLLLEQLEAKVDLDKLAPRLKAQLARSWPFDEIAKRLIKRGATVDAADDHQQTPLHVAVTNGATGLVELLIESGAELDAQDEWQETPLCHAAETGQLESTHRLLRAGALPIGALQPAAAAGHVEILRALIDAGADVDENDETKEEPLLAAARYGRDGAIELLLAAGASPEARDYDGNSALHLAASAFAPPTVIERLADACGVNVRGEDGRTPLHAAATAVNAPAVAQLLSLGADASLRAGGEVSPLHAFFDDLDAFRVADAARLLRQLVKAGCDPSQPDQAGRVPRALGMHFDEPIRKALGATGGSLAG